MFKICIIKQQFALYAFFSSEASKSRASDTSQVDKKVSFRANANATLEQVQNLKFPFTHDFKQLIGADCRFYTMKL